VKRYAWRLTLSLLVVVSVSVGLAVQGSATLAVGAGTFIKVGDNHFRDPACGTSNALFNVRTFQDTQYQGRRVDLCGTWSDFCNIPFGDESPSAVACRSFGVDQPTLNDVISSIKVMAVHGGELCRVVIHEHPNHAGGALRRYDPVDIPTLVPWPHDALSSITRVC